MSCNSCPVSDPILSSQVTDVDLRMPKCMDTCDNSLNGWLKWLAEKQCECDWESYNLEGIQPLLQAEPTTISLCTIVSSLLEAVETLSNDLETCCEEVEYTLQADEWTATRTLRALKKGRQVTLTGSAVANVSYTGTITNLHPDIIPANSLTIPVAHDFAPSSTYNIFLRISSLGGLTLNFSGSAPAYGAARTVYLDGVTFFLD